MEDFVLYSYYRSSASYRVRIALGLKGIKYEYRPVHLLNSGGEQFKDEYAHLNPSREVPTLVHGGKALGQSVAIIHYLDAIHPQTPLFPREPFLHAQVLQACEIINSGTQPLVNLRVLAELERSDDYTPQRKQIWSAHWIRAGLKAFESLLTKTAGTYCFGHEVSAADVFLVPQMYSATRNNVSLEEFPLLHRIYKNCLQLEPFQKAAPEVQPDTPKDS
jgi:maleylacetoacetate isomerase